MKLRFPQFHLNLLTGYFRCFPFLFFSFLFQSKLGWCSNGIEFDLFSIDLGCDLGCNKMESAKYYFLHTNFVSTGASFGAESSNDQSILTYTCNVTHIVEFVGGGFYILVKHREGSHTSNPLLLLHLLLTKKKKIHIKSF